jgi:Fic family protein
MNVPKRPQNEEELQKREAIGTIRASRFVRKFAKSNDVINVDVICLIHIEIFKEAWPEIAGVWRIESVKIADSHHLPPHFSEVPQLMEVLNKEFVEKITNLKSIKGFVLGKSVSADSSLQAIEDIIGVAAWIHHKITHIHPFRDGNGRTARLVTNLILERYGLVGISLKIERENKNEYRKALSQIDSHGDFEPLLNIISHGLTDRYNGILMEIV